MGWEHRNGKRYFYRKVRNGRRVHSEYWGSGEAALFLEEMIIGDPVAKVMDRDMHRSEQEYEQSFVQRIEESEREIMRHVAERLLACGFHQHKGQWRKSRNEP